MIEVDKNRVARDLVDAGISDGIIGIIYTYKDPTDSLERTVFEQSWIGDMPSPRRVNLYALSRYIVEEDNFSESEGGCYFPSVIYENIRVFEKPLEFHIAMNDIINPINKQRRLRNEAIDEGKEEGEKEKLLDNYGDFLNKVIAYDGHKWK